MKPSEKHLERESLAAAIKGLSVEGHLAQKQASQTRDSIDDFAAWHERFRHELACEFGDVPDDEDEAALKAYILQMKKKFRLWL